ncbi:AraC family transcriptional regulator (plasmid) [Kitasatospora sp. NBC_00070]|uniref:AraC family transcriptional regulator n=1 Tax=Kitasatospora sp. NBC_00070 TaxID=2975962 RepID=UPI002F907FDE
MTGPRTVSTSYARTLLGAVRAAGEDGGALLQGVVSEARLAESGGRIGADAMRLLWERAVELTGEGLMGLRMARAVRPGSFHVLGLLFLHAPTLGHALEYLLRYQRLVSEAGVLSTRQGDRGGIVIRYAEPPGGPGLLPQQVDAILGSIVVQAGWLRDRPFGPAGVTFRHEPQGDPAAYRALFGVTPRFGADADELTVAVGDLAAPLPSADAELCGMHRELADRLLDVLPGPGATSAFAVRWLSSRSAAAVRIDDLAVTLSTSVRSLQRRLRDEGTTWQQLVDTARREQLVGLLSGRCSLETAARRLGYHDASSLSRAARRWFGTTPGQWREGLLPGP